MAGKNDIANFVSKTDLDDKLKNLNKKVTSNKTKQVPVENELNKPSKKIKAISTKGLIKDLINGSKILNGARYFSSGVLENYLIFLSNKKYFRLFTNTSQVLSRKSKGFSEEIIENITTILAIIVWHFLII